MKITDIKVLKEGTLSVDVPNEDWLQDKIDYAKSKGRNSFGVPYMGSTTASVRGAPPKVRVQRLASLPGMRNEQSNVRRDDLKWLMDYMDTHKKLPPMGSNPNEEYLPYIMVAYNGEAWVNEGNHRIMAAYRLNWPDMPIEIRYFDGGERVRDGAMYPGKIGLGEVDVPKSESMTEIFEPGKQNWKWRRQSSDEAFASFVVGDREYQWHAFNSDANATKWEIQFRLMRVPADPDGLDLFGQTGTGNSAQVLSTAVDITRAFLQAYGLDKVEEITFNAKEDSRIDLYAKMIRRLLPTWELSNRKSRSHGMQFTLTDPRAYDKPENKITEIDRMPGNEYTGGKKSLRIGAGDKNIRKLPGTNAFMYSTEANHMEDGIIIKLWDSANTTPKPVKMRGEDGYEFAWRLQDWERNQSEDGPGTLIGKLVLEDVPHFPLKGALQVDTITVDEDYRGQGVAKSMYGVVLSILRRPLLAGRSQTPGGRRNWLSLATTPGVEIKGYVMINQARFDNPEWADKDIDIVMGKLGGQYIGPSKPPGIHYFAFDIVPGSGELAPAVRTELSKIYNEHGSRTGLYAVWHGALSEDLTESIAEGENDVVTDLEQDLENPHSYDAIDHMMQTIAKEHGITAKQLHNMFVDKHGQVPDEWVNSLAENFADGKNPQDKGDSRRHGIPKGATMAELEKASHASGRKGQLARWQLNMRRGQKKATEGVVAEGGWASTETQNTVITPRTIAEIVHILDGFAASYNAWQAANELDAEIKIGKPKGSGTYYRRDLEQDPNREYGDVDVECFVHSRKGSGSAQRVTEYRRAIKDYCAQSPDFSTDNGTNVIMRTTAGPVQVDLIYTFHEHADWSRVLSPEYRVKGVISTSLTSSIAEALNLSFSSQGIQVKIRNNQPVSFRQSKDTELRTVSINPDNWAQDIYSLYYYLSHGEKPADMPRDLQAHGGLKDEQRLSDIVLSIKALASGLEESNLLAHGALIDIADKKDLIRRVATIYSDKLAAAENSSKFNKASTPAAVEKAKKTKLMLAKYRNEVTKLLLN